MNFIEQYKEMIEVENRFYDTSCQLNSELLNMLDRAIPRLANLLRSSEDAVTWLPCGNGEEDKRKFGFRWRGVRLCHRLQDDTLEVIYFKWDGSKFFREECYLAGKPPFVSMPKGQAVDQYVLEVLNGVGYEQLD